jgi:hypothetical protein
MLYSFFFSKPAIIPAEPAIKAINPNNPNAIMIGQHITTHHETDIYPVIFNTIKQTNKRVQAEFAGVICIVFAILNP